MGVPSSSCSSATSLLSSSSSRSADASRSRSQLLRRPQRGSAQSSTIASRRSSVATYTRSRSRRSSSTRCSSPSAAWAEGGRARRLGLHKGGRAGPASGDARDARVTRGLTRARKGSDRPRPGGAATRRRRRSAEACQGGRAVLARPVAPAFDSKQEPASSRIARSARVPLPRGGGTAAVSIPAPASPPTGHSAAAHSSVLLLAQRGCEPMAP